MFSSLVKGVNTVMRIAKSVCTTGKIAAIAAVGYVASYGSVQAADPNLDAFDVESTAEKVWTIITTNLSTLLIFLVLAAAIPFFIKWLKSMFK